MKPHYGHKHASGAATQPASATRLRHNTWNEVDDALVVEEPLEIRLNGRRFTATMRTPGHDDLLARGLLFSEGVIAHPDDIESLELSTRCREGEAAGDELVHVANAILHDDSAVPAHLWERSIISNSSCGLCGKASVEAMTARTSRVPDCAPVSASRLLSLPNVMREQQELFRQTGGLHAAAFFDASGTLLACYEDIGRHNATDKAIGRGLLDGWLPWNRDGEPLILLVSGRASFEIVQKALMARASMVCSVSAASSLAVELAQAGNLTLVGFLREAGFTIYTGRERVEK